MPRLALLRTLSRTLMPNSCRCRDHPVCGERCGCLGRSAHHDSDSPMEPGARALWSTGALELGRSGARALRSMPRALERHRSRANDAALRSTGWRSAAGGLSLVTPPPASAERRESSRSARAARSVAASQNGRRAAAQGRVVHPCIARAPMRAGGPPRRAQRGRWRSSEQQAEERPHHPATRVRGAPRHGRAQARLSLARH